MNILKTYIAEIQTVVFGKNYIHIMVHVLNGSRKTSDNITKTPHLQEQNGCT